MLKGNHMSLNPLARLRPPAVRILSNARAIVRPLSRNPSPAVLDEAAAPHKISRHQGQRGGVRLAGGTCAWGRDDALAEWVREALLAAPVEPGVGSGVDSGEVALAEVLALRSLLLESPLPGGEG